MSIKFLDRCTRCVLWLLISSEEIQLVLTWAEIKKSLIHNKAKSKSGWKKGFTHIFRPLLLSDLCFFLYVSHCLISPRTDRYFNAIGDLTIGSKLRFRSSEIHHQKEHILSTILDSFLP